MDMANEESICGHMEIAEKGLETTPGKGNRFLGDFLLVSLSSSCILAISPVLLTTICVSWRTYRRPSAICLLHISPIITNMSIPSNGQTATSSSLKTKPKSPKSSPSTTHVNPTSVPEMSAAALPNGGLRQRGPVEEVIAKRMRQLGKKLVS